MQQEMLSRADAIFSYVGETVAKATDFASQQVPDIATQFILYSRATSTVGMVVGLCILWGTIYGVYKLYNSDAYDASPLMAFPLIGSILIISLNWTTFFMSWFAPKLFILLELVKLVK